MKKLFNKYKNYIPNILTTLRLVAVPVFWVLTLTGHPLSAAILFGSACTTDALDGYLARRWKVESIYGKLTDPLADKMLVMSALLLNGITTNPLMLIPFTLESGIAIVNIKDFIKDVDIKKLIKKEYIKELVLNRNKVRVSQTGREKTIFLMSTVSLGILSAGIKIPLEKIVNGLICITSTIEAATLTEYIDAKIINKSDSTMRLPDFIKNENNREKNVEEIENNISLSNNREDKINQLYKEKEFLITKDIHNSKTRNKKL